MEFRLLGPLEVSDNGRSIAIASGKQRSLLADLLLHANRAVPVTQLVDDLWGERVPETAVKALQVYVSKLRKALPEGRLATRGSGYMLVVAEGELDVELAERLAREGRAALASGDPAHASAVLTQALSLWRGPALAELDGPFAPVEAARLEEVRLGLLEERIDADLALGRHAVLVPELDALAAGHPLRERLREQLMLALYRSRRQAEALDAYQSFRQKLDDELGIEPSQRLRELERRILQQDPALAPRPPSPRAAAGPSGRQRPEVAGRPPVGVVGREQELGRLEQFYGDAAAGERRLVFVSGEPGAGKTTLVFAFLEGLDTSVHVGRGQCVESRGAGEAYMPVLEALGRLCRADDGSRLVQLLRERAPTWLVQLPWLVAEEERASLETRMVGITRDRMLREIVEVLEAFSADEPTVLVLEDLHWADYSTLDLLDVIARRFEPARLLVLGTFRQAEARSAGHPLRGLVQSLRVRNLCAEVALGSLSEPATRAFLALHLDGTDPGSEVAALLHLRTLGNPLYMEKLVEAWIDEGALTRESGAWVVARDLDELARSVPETLRSLIEQRCAALEPDTHRLLEAVSVAGAEFATATAAAAAEMDEDEAERRLRDVALDATFIRAIGDDEWPDGTISTRYGFTHDLVYETLQERLPAGQRARVHRRIGDRLEAAHADRVDEIATELAWHFVEGREPRRAVRHLHAAAARALELSAPREAIEHLTTARDALPAVAGEPERVDLELGIQQLLGRAMLVTEGWSSAEAESALVRAKDLAREVADETVLASTLHGLATVYEVRGEYERSEALLRESLGLSSIENVPGSVVDSNELMACSLYHQGSFERSLAHAETALSHYDGVYENRLTAAFGEHPDVSCQLWAALSTWFLGFPDEAMERAERAVASSTIGARARARAVAQAQASVVAHLRGDVAATREWSAAAIEAGSELGFTYWRAMAGVLHGWARAAGDDSDGGLAEIRESIDLSRGLGARMDDAFYLTVLADAARRDGRRDAALAALDEAGDLTAARPFFLASELLRLRGELLEGAEGVKCLREALELAEARDSPALRLRAATSLARRTRALDDAGVVAEVVGRFVEGDGTADLMAARALLAELGVEPLAPLARPARPEGLPPVRYARSGELSIAYQVTGNGMVDVLLVPGFVSHLEKDWEEPRHAAFLERFGSFSRLIRFDKRGTGLSDRPAGVPDLETRMDDLRAVQEAAESRRAILFGYSEGGPLSILYAGTHPERVAGLVLFGTYAKRSLPDEDYPWARTAEQRAARIEVLTRNWGFESHMRVMCPSADDAMARWWGERGRAAASPGAVRALLEMNSLIDVRHLLGAIHVPTLVLHRTGDRAVRVDEGRYIAERIPGARFVELAGDDHFVAIDPDQILDVVEPFVREISGDLPPGAGIVDERVLVTVMVTDIVDSTATATRLGDRAWADLLERQLELVRLELARHRGEEIDAVGDGVLALFDGPARAIRCGHAINESLADLGLGVRVGVHTGEVERVDSIVRGIAVDLAALISALAAPGEVLVSATTRDLVAGSGLAFADRGEHELKGIPEPRRLFALTGQAAAGS